MLSFGNLSFNYSESENFAQFRNIALRLQRKQPKTTTFSLYQWHFCIFHDRKRQIDFDTSVWLTLLLYSLFRKKKRKTKTLRFNHMFEKYRRVRKRFIQTLGNLDFLGLKWIFFSKKWIISSKIRIKCQQLRVFSDFVWSKNLIRIFRWRHLVQTFGTFQSQWAGNRKRDQLEKLKSLNFIRKRNLFVVQSIKYFFNSFFWIFSKKLEQKHELRIKFNVMEDDLNISYICHIGYVKSVTKTAQISSCQW